MVLAKHFVYPCLITANLPQEKDGGRSRLLVFPCKSIPT